MKDLVIYEKTSRIIVAIITDYNENEKRNLILNQNLETAIVNSTDKYIIGDDLTGVIKFKNPKSNIIYLDDYIGGIKI